MSEERFEVFGNVIKDNEDIPALLNNYQATVRLNELNDKVKELEQGLAEYKKYKEWQEQLDCKNADELIDFVMSNYLTEDEKCKTIKELNKQLAELKEKAIVPKFKGSSIVYSIAFKEIEKVQVIAYLNKCIILCRNLKTRELHTIHCDYLFETEQEAQAKLKEMKGNE